MCSMTYPLLSVKDRALLELDIDAVWKRSIVLSLQGIEYLHSLTSKNKMEAEVRLESEEK